MKSAKYLAAYIAPALAVIGLLLGGWWAYGVVLFAFGLVPILDQALIQDPGNVPEETRQSYLSKRIFDWLLYLNIPVVYGIVALFIYQLNTGSWTNSELTGFVLSVGIVIGACGINVAHELGHRSNKMEQLMAKILYIPALYQHFFIEHNRGHHKNVATPEDPATARRNEILYFFWIRSLWGGYRSAWKLANQQLRRADKPVWSFSNEMIQFTVIQFAYLGLIWWLTSSWVHFLFVVLAAMVGVLLLETINYIEHYGLIRARLANGRYERVQPHHSWNANYHMGRIVLYELTRHSDHHYLADKKYQILDHHEEAPELPLGYPASMLMAFVPPLWISFMNRRLDQVQGTSVAA